MLQGVKELLRLADRCRKQCLLLLIFYDFFVRFLGLHSCLKNSSFKSKNVHLFPLKLSIRRSFPNSKPMKSTILADFMILSNLEIPGLSRWTKDLLHKQKSAPFFVLKQKFHQKRNSFGLKAIYKIHCLTVTLVSSAHQLSSNRFFRGHARVLDEPQ